MPATMRRYAAAAEAIAATVPPGSTVYLSGWASVPTTAAGELVSLARRRGPIRIITAAMLPGNPLARWPGPSAGRVDLLYVGRDMHEGVRAGWADYLPMQLSRFSHAIKRGELRIDVACVRTTPPDDRGRCHLGMSVDVMPEIVAVAGVVVAEFDASLPRPSGASWIPVDSIDASYEVWAPATAPRPRTASSVDKAIAQHVAPLIAAGSTIQLGVGTVMDSIATALEGHRDLGIHSGLFTEGLLGLVNSGAVSNRRKGIDPGRSVATMAVGGDELRDFMDANPAVELHPVSYTHNPRVLAQLPRLAAINGAYQVDLTGAINAEANQGFTSAGVGGQVDFARAAHHAPEGKFIIAMRSTAGDQSRIVPRLSSRSAVTATRSDAHWFVTEYGSIDVSTLTLQERADALIRLAHPTHRRALQEAADREQ